MSIASKPLEARRATQNRFFFRALMKNDNQYLNIELQDYFLFFKLLSFTLLCYSIPSKLIYGECWTKDCLAGKRKAPKCQGRDFLWPINLAAAVNFMFSRWHSGKESASQCRGSSFDPWVWKIPWSREWQPTPVFLPGKFHKQRNLVGYSPWGCKELDTAGWETEQAHVNLTTCGV